MTSIFNHTPPNRFVKFKHSLTPLFCAQTSDQISNQKVTRDQFTPVQFMGISALSRFPRVDLSHTPTPFEPMLQLQKALGSSDNTNIWIKRDDATGLAMGGNKARQLEYYIGDAIAQGADTILTTGAVQSNHVRMTAAAARKLGLHCEIQLEERVSNKGKEYYESGNPFLVQLFDTPVHHYPVGEDEEGADQALFNRAEELKAEGRTPYVIQLAKDHKPIGALGYVKAAEELLQQSEENNTTIDAVVLASGSGSTHAGLLTGLRALGSKAKVYGICVRRDAQAQRARILKKAQQVAEMIDKPGIITEDDINVSDSMLGDGYGRLSAHVREAISLTAQQEGILLDPTYTGKAMAGLIELARSGEFKGKNVVFLHTGGTPALFAYPELVEN